MDPDQSTEQIPPADVPRETTAVQEAAQIAADAEAAAAEAAAALAQIEAEEKQDEIVSSAVEQAEAVAVEAAAFTFETLTQEIQQWKTETLNLTADHSQRLSNLETLAQQTAEAISAIPALMSASVEDAIRRIAPAKSAPQSVTEEAAAVLESAPADPLAAVENLPPAPAAPEKPRRSWI